MKPIIVSPHDKITKTALENIEVAREYFQNYLPTEVLQAVDLKILALCPTQHINKFLKLTDSDVIYKTVLKGREEECYLYIANENQVTDSVFMPLRVLEYNVGIWQYHRKQNPSCKKLPLIINLVYYSGEKPYKNSRDFRDLLAAPKELIDAFWLKPFILIEAQKLSDEEILRQKWAGLFLYATKHIRSPDFLAHIKKILNLMKAIDQENAIDYIESIVLYTLTAGEISDPETYVQSLKAGLSEETGERVMTGLERLIEIREKRGIEKGMQQGMQQGILTGAREGEKSVLMKLLNKRFKTIPLEILKKIEVADSEMLLQWAERILEAKTIDEIFESYH